MSQACGWLPHIWGKYIVTGGITTILMPENAGITPLLTPNTETIQSKFVSHPQSIPDWESRSEKFQ
jgi:hypothetical protein